MDLLVILLSYLRRSEVVSERRWRGRRLHIYTGGIGSSESSFGDDQNCVEVDGVVFCCCWHLLPDGWMNSYRKVGRSVGQVTTRLALVARNGAHAAALVRWYLEGKAVHPTNGDGKDPAADKQGGFVVAGSVALRLLPDPLCLARARLGGTLPPLSSGRSRAPTCRASGPRS